MTHRIVIVGGGAGGLELATRLGGKLGRRGKAAITLIDRFRTHLWKPLLHEVAAGSMDVHAHQLDYLAQAYWRHFTFCFGAMDGLDRARREVFVAPVHDAAGVEVIPRRAIGYDTLVIAVGSEVNDFGTPGVAQYAFALDTAKQAASFQRSLVNACLRADHVSPAAHAKQLNVVIVGGGATGVELAAELHRTTRLLAAYGLKNFNPEQDLKLTLINADARILPALPEYLSVATADVLRGLNVDIRCNELATEVTADAVLTRGGQRFPADLSVWAAGIRAPVFLREIDGLETNRLDQLVVQPTLQTTRDPDIFAFGDCAACPWGGQEGMVPPRAQAAHQQASLLCKNLAGRLDGKPLRPFHYRDFGSLVSLGKYSTVGNLMGFVSGGSLRIEGWFARLMYESLYKMHLMALHGFLNMALDTLARFIGRRTEPRVKLH